MASTESKRFSLSLSIGTIVFIVFVFAGYLVISNLVGEQSRQQQQSVSPVFALIENELGAPLHIAKTLADAGIFDVYFEQSEPDSEQLLEFLGELSDKFGHEFYLAHDKSRKQYNSDGRVFDLIEGQVFWYFALKDEFDSKVQAVLGKREDVHLYIDVRQYDEFGNFIGFVGLGKSLADFINSFRQFRAEYGHEFIFVNNRNQIVLSSIESLAPRQAIGIEQEIGIKNIDEVSWFAEFNESAGESREPSEIVANEQGDLLITRLNLHSLNWQVYLVTPLNVRQAEVNKSFAIYIATGLIMCILLYKLIQRLAEAYMQKVSHRVNRDSLSNLPNREHAGLYFSMKRKHQRQMSVIIANIDDFCEINSTHGKSAGDKAVKDISKILRSLLKGDDIVVRWDEDQFVFILPDTLITQANQLAEQCRVKIETHYFEYNKKNFRLTASFGVYASRQYEETLTVMVELAKKALLNAKLGGSNQVSLV